MAWDSARPVPWKRLMRDWLIYLGLMIVVLAVVSRDNFTPATIVTLAPISFVVFVLFGALLAKLGYQRKTLKQVRAESDARAAGRASDRPSGSESAPSRPRPAPTKRTSGGNRPTQRKKR